MRAPIRVLHVIKGLSAGGAERLLVSIAAAADPAVVRYEVAHVLPTARDLVPELEALGVAVHRLAPQRAATDPAWPWRLRRLARRFDLVHVHSPAIAAIARIGLAPRRLVSTEHNLWPSYHRLTRLANAMTAPLDRQRWAVSEEVVASAWRPWRRRMEVLVHGVPVAELRGRHARASRDDDVLVAIVANLRPNKDYPTVFAAAAAAIAEEPRLRFVSIGQGPKEAELRRELASHELGDRFVMLGYHDDPPAVLAGADIFTLSSIHEGLPISLLEAMALGLAPVVTRVGGNAEVVTDGVDGLLVEPSRPDLLAAAYVELARNPGRRAQLGAAAARRAENFDIAKTARIVEARYRELVRR